jgi:hypothetical protein
MVKGKDHSVFGTEARECPLELAGEVIGVGKRGPVVDRVFDGDREIRRLAARPRRECGAAAIDGDAEDPRPERTTGVEPADRA